MQIKKAMIVDDEKFDLKTYRRVLERSGLVDQVLTFASAEEAMDFLRSSSEHVIDVIFLDINMPRMNGYEFLQAMTDELKPGVVKSVVVMLTTSLHPAGHQRASEFQLVKSFVAKPLTEESVKQVAKLIDD